MLVSDLFVGISFLQILSQSLKVQFILDCVQNEMREFRLFLSLLQVVVDTSLESPAGLAIDWVTSKLYWTDAGKWPPFT